MRRLTCKLTYVLLLWGVVFLDFASANYSPWRPDDAQYQIEVSNEFLYSSPLEAAAVYCEWFLTSPYNNNNDTQCGTDYVQVATVGYWFGSDWVEGYRYHVSLYHPVYGWTDTLIVQSVRINCGAEYWNPETKQCQVDPVLTCAERAGDTATYEIMIHDGTAPTNAANVHNKNSYEGCEVTNDTVNDCYSYRSGPANPFATYCSINGKYTGNAYIGTNDPLAPPSTETKESTTLSEAEQPAWQQDYDTNFPENGCVTDGNGVQTCVKKEQTVTTENIHTTVTWDGSTFSYNTDNGSTETVTTTETIVTNPDNSSTVTTSVTTDKTDNGSTSTTITMTGATSGGQPPTTNNYTTTTVTNYDSSGNKLNETTTTEDNLDYGDSPSPEGYANGDTSGIDSSIDSYKAVPAAPLEQPALSLNFTFGQACNAGDYSLNFMGFSASIDICPYIGYLQTILYWVFYLFTAVFVFLSVSHLNR